MRTLAEFEGYYRATLLPILQRLQRRKAWVQPHFWRWMRWPLLAALLGTVVFAMLPKSIKPLFVPFMPLMWGTATVVIPVFRIVNYWIGYSRVERDEKREAVLPAIQFLIPGYSYTATGHLPMARVLESRLWFGNVISVEGKDLFTGKVGDTPVEFSEIKVTTRSADGEELNRPHKSDHGSLFFMADFNKPLKGTTIVTPDLLEQTVGAHATSLLEGIASGLGKALLGAKDPDADLHLVRMDHAQFELAYRVKSTDPIEANYILTPNVMERMLELSRKAGWFWSLCFTGTHVFMRLSRVKGIFRIDPFDDSLDFNTYRRLYDVVTLTQDVVNDLNLNTRLWTER